MDIPTRLRNAAGAFVSNARNPDLRRAQLSFAGAWTAEWAFTVGLAIVAYRDGGAGAVGFIDRGGLARPGDAVHAVVGDGAVADGAVRADLERDAGAVQGARPGVGSIGLKAASKPAVQAPLHGVIGGISLAGENGVQNPDEDAARLTAAG